MNENFNDFPLFLSDVSENESSNSSKMSKVKPLAVIEAEADIKRKDKILSFSFKLIRYFLVACGCLIIADVIFQKIGVMDSLASEFFDLLKYSITSVLGYLFASENKK